VRCRPCFAGAAAARLLVVAALRTTAAAGPRVGAESRHRLAMLPCFSLRPPAREASATAAPPPLTMEAAVVGCVDHPHSLLWPSA
jgi:hypothetical protein